MTAALCEELEALDYEQLLNRLLLADNRIDRRLIVDELAARNWGFMTVLDSACAARADGRPKAFPLEHFLTHLNRTESRLVTRGRIHTPSNVEWGDSEDAAGGVAFAFGAGR